MEDDNGNGSAITILVAIVIVIIIGIAFYFGFMRGDNATPNDTNGGANIEVNVPDVGNGANENTNGGGLY